MTAESVIEIIRQALTTALWLSAPLLIVGFIAGVAISLVQTLTSMQDSAFSTVPRIAAFVAAILLSMPWMLRKMVAYTAGILGSLERYAR